MPDDRVVEVSATAVLGIVAIGGGWLAAVAALVDAIRRRARGNEAAGTWVVFLVVGLLAVPLAGLVAVAYFGSAVLWERRRPQTLPVEETGQVSSRTSRLLAAVIDSLVLAVPMAALVWRYSTIDLDDRVFDTPNWIPWLGWSAGVAYHVVAVAAWGQTVGKLALGIEVVGASGDRPSIVAALKRSTPLLLTRVPYVGSLLSLVAYVPILWRSDRRGFHDLFARTSVVRKPAFNPQPWHHLRWLTAAVGALVICAAVAFAGESDRESRHLTVTVTTVRTALWDNGRPHAENMQRAREIVERCLGAGVEPGEAVYDHIAMPLEQGRTLSEAQGLELRIIGTDSDCDRQALLDPIRTDRLNVYVVDGRAVWSRIF